MNPVAMFESFIERLMERSFSRAAQSRLQPVELAKYMSRIMDREQVVGVLGVRVPNIFDVELSQVDFAQFKPIQASVAQEIEAYLARVARDRLYVLASPPIVRLHCNKDLTPGHYEIRAHMEDLGVPVASASGAAAPAAQHTRIMQMPPAVKQPTHRRIAQLVAPDRSFRLEANPVTIGRNADNVVVIEDRRVSRHHAELEQSDGRWLIRDLGSTNGTAVNGRLVRQTPLEDGDRVSLGGFEVIFQD